MQGDHWGDTGIRCSFSMCRMHLVNMFIDFHSDVSLIAGKRDRFCSLSLLEKANVYSIITFDLIICMRMHLFNCKFK